jgi:serine/threonine-protein kinase
MASAEALANTPGFRTGQVIAGRYAIQGVIGAGGMATIVEATHVELGSRVAIKVLSTLHMTDEAIERFLREARAIFPLRSENVCRVLDLGRLPEGAPFIVMEFLDGNDFAHAFKTTQVPPARAIALVLQACRGLGEAHALGIVHRDIKPANLFLTKRSDGTELVKVLDFGISKLRIEGVENLTADGQILGTPRYMAPEQFGGTKETDSRADVWAIGLVLYKLVVGRLPYTATSIADIYAELATRDPEDIRRAVPNIDPELAKVVMRCIERDASKRFANATELAAALEACTKTAASDVLSAMPVAPLDLSPTIRDEAPPKRSRAPIIAIAAFATGAVAVAAFIATRPNKNSTALDAAIADVASASESVSVEAGAAIVVEVADASQTIVDANVVTVQRDASIRSGRDASTSGHKPNCSPPWYEDAHGNRVFKTECVH